MAEEYFWGLTLEGGSGSVGSWDPENDAAEAKDGKSHDGLNREHGAGFGKFDIQVEQTLIIRQAVLGAKAKPDELNIVEVSTLGINGSIKIPVVRLKVGEQTQCRLDLTFPDPPVSFTLVEGSGPVHLSGNIGVPTGQLPDEEEEDDVDDLDEEDDENIEDSEEDIQNDKGDKRRKISASTNGKNKKIKLEEMNDEGDDDEDSKKKFIGGKKDKPKKQK